MDNNSYEKLINRILDKRYRIENVVGVGGMAYVLKAHDIVDNRDVAIKILNDEFRDDERAVKRFINESKTVSMLDHENIVKIFDVVITDERKYIVMEFIDGITLKDYIDRIGVLSWKEAVYYIKQILRALSHAHEKQVIHRDIKPQNIMLLSDGTIKVTDFGIAKIPNAESITMTDKAIGTVNYISPEQASGGKVDFRTDIYSAGVMLYEMVTGRLPFIADSPVAVAMMQVSNEPLSPREINPQIPAGLEQIILKAMQKNPEDRFINASAMLKALDYFTDNPDVVFATEVSGTGATGVKEKKGEYENSEKQKARIKKRVRGSRAMFPIVAGVASSFALVGIIFVIVWVLPFFKGAAEETEDSSVIDVLGSSFSTAVDRFLGVDNNNTQDKEVKVASFVGSKYDEDLVSYMESLGFTPETVNYVRNANYGANIVVRQDPEADSIRLKSDDGRLIPVTLYVNMGEEEMEMPDCTLMFVSDAKKVIRTEANALLVSELPSEAIEVIEEYHDTYPADYVIRTEPAAGELINLSEDVSFKLYVSKGQKISNTVVPELEGKKLDDAKRSILSAKLALGRVYYEESETIGAGLVIKASHSAGEVVAQGITSVDLWVSIGSSKAPVVPETPITDDNSVTGTQNSSDNSNENNSAPENSAAAENPSSADSEDTNSSENTDTADSSESEQKDDAQDNSDEASSANDNGETLSENAEDIAGLLDMRNSDD